MKNLIKILRVNREMVGDKEIVTKIFIALNLDYVLKVEELEETCLITMHDATTIEVDGTLNQIYARYMI